MTNETEELFAKLLADNLSLQADVTLLKGFFMNHIEEYNKAKGVKFNADVFEEGYSKKRRELYEQLFVTYPVISDELSRMIRKELGL